MSRTFFRAGLASAAGLLLVVALVAPVLADAPSPERIRPVARNVLPLSVVDSETMTMLRRMSELSELGGVAAVAGAVLLAAIAVGARLER